MSAPMNFAEAKARGLIVEEGIHTFSNGSHHEGWADGNCFECAYYEFDGNAGEYCAFECAAFLGMVSPALAVLFGWREDAEYPGSYNEPRTCTFFRQRFRKDDGDDNEFVPPPPPPDPSQLVLLADPSEDAALLMHAPEALEVFA